MYNLRIYLKRGAVKKDGKTFNVVSFKNMSVQDVSDTLGKYVNLEERNKIQIYKTEVR